jgi:hypothetical protein
MLAVWQSNPTKPINPCFRDKPRKPEEDENSHRRKAKRKEKEQRHYL